jgi:fatty acid desaturase
MAAPADVRAFVADHDLTVRNSWRAAGRTAVIGGMYAAVTAVGLLVGGAIVWTVVIAAQGFILVGAYSAMHETAHGTLFGSRPVNRAASFLWGLTLLTNASLWRCFHLEHHARTGGDDDPEARYKVQITHPAQYLLVVPGGLQFVGQFWIESLDALFGRYPSYVRKGADTRSIKRDAVILLAASVGIAALLVTHPLAVLHLWGGAFLVAMCVLLPLTAINEHYGCASGGEAFNTTRTVVSNRAFRLLVWNTNYHVEHHLIATVPYHHVHQLHEYIEPRCQFVSRSYTAFHLDVLRSCGRKQPARVA